VFVTPKCHLEVDERTPLTPYGGVALLAGLWKRLGAAEVIDGAVHVLRRPHPYHESDHVMAQVVSLLIGGDCIEDMTVLQHDEPLLRILGAGRSPDPTTAGVFLRRFDSEQHPRALEDLRYAVDSIQDRVWDHARRRRGTVRRLGPLGIVDLDSHVASTYGRQKEGADFSYNGKWGYHTLMASLANTGEILDVVQRSGNAHSAQGAAEMLARVLPQVLGRYGFQNVLMRGDSAFDLAGAREECERHGAFYAMVAKEIGPKPRRAAELEEDWTEYIPAARKAPARSSSAWLPITTARHRRAGPTGVVAEIQGQAEGRQRGG
jgi:hypothetical protein